jgi:hypothetical protein
MVIIQNSSGNPCKGAANSQASGLDVHSFPALIHATVRANLVRLLHFMAVRALRQRGGGKKIVRAPFVLASV